MKAYFEDDRTELKRELIDEVKCEILAFLNSDGGTIYVGVEDDGTVVGFKNNAVKDEIDLKLGNWLEDNFFPKPANLVKFFFNEDDVLEIRICKGTHKPYYLKEKGPKPSGVYIRVGRSKRRASEDEILRMIMQSNKYSYEDEISDEQELTFKSLRNSFEDNNLSFTSRVMKSLGLVSKTGEYTNLAYLLSDQSEIVVKFASFDSLMNFRVKKTFKGSLITILEKVEQQCELLNDLRVVIDGSRFKRKETLSYPKVALREMIINAICHADYFIRSNIKIEFFVDKVKITSPGGVFDASIEEIMNGIQTYRNPRLVHVFDKLGLVENFGTGIPRTLEAYKEYEVKPEFKDTGNFFIVTLPNVNYSNDDYLNTTRLNDQTSDEINDKINDLGLEILKLIKAMPGINVPILYERLKLKDPSVTVDRVRNEIRRNLTKYVEHKGSNKSGGYYLKNR